MVGTQTFYRGWEHQKKSRWWEHYHFSLARKRDRSFERSRALRMSERTTESTTLHECKGSAISFVDGVCESTKYINGACNDPIVFAQRKKKWSNLLFWLTTTKFRFTAGDMCQIV